METIQTRGHPDVFLRTKFVNPASKKFRAYLEYMDRDEAIRNAHFSEYSAYIGTYMDNPRKRQLNTDSEKCSALFDGKSDTFSSEEKEKAKRLFQKAQANKSPMWQTVISFKNSFLAEQGIYEPVSGWVDDNRLRAVTRQSMEAMLQNEKMVGSAVWTASVHYNTDNIHIHIAVVEPKPTREKILFHGKQQYRASLHQGTIRKMKSRVANSILNQSEEMKKLHELSRDRIIHGHSKNIFEEDDILKKLFLNLYHTMPKNRRLWKYNMNGLKYQRPMIDDLSKAYIKRYYKADFEKYSSELDKQEKVYRSVYGNGKSSYKDNKIKDLYKRLGNTILKEMLSFDKKRRYIQSHKKGNWLRRRFSAGASIERSLNSSMALMQKAMRADCTNYKAQAAYNELIDSIEAPSDGERR
ncbi:MAG: relaxase MobL [Oscillospiraceae bacterium]|jgi:hypothetical protein|nr:relaxase MobL [Oscillospiraceae bacterium]